MQTSNLPSRIPVPFANAGAKNSIPVASQIGITPGAASYTDGFPPATRTPIAAGGVPPYGVDFNGILNAITAQNQWENAGGQYPFDAAFAATVGGYPKGALLARIGYDGFWISTADNNTTNPDTGGAGWVPLFGVGGDYALDTGTANTYVVAYTPGVVSVVDGMVVKFKAKTANTGASTFAPNGLVAKAIVGAAHTALQGGEIVPNGDVWLQWNSSIGTGSWVLVDATGGALQVAPAIQSQHAAQLQQVGLRSIQVFIGGGSFTVGAATTRIKARVWGGGGGGGGSSGTTGAAGSGGGGGGYSEGYFMVTPGQVLAITVGSAGGAGGAGGNGAAGGTSSVGALLSATGGAAGLAGTSGAQSSAGVGGSASGGAITLSGQNGFPGFVSGNNGFGGAGGGAFSANGGPSSLGNGASGVAPGGGGGGGNGSAAGSGQLGLIIIEY